MIDRRGVFDSFVTMRDLCHIYGLHFRTAREIISRYNVEYLEKFDIKFYPIKQVEQAIKEYRDEARRSTGERSF